MKILAFFLGKPDSWIDRAFQKFTKTIEPVIQLGAMAIFTIFICLGAYALINRAGFETWIETGFGHSLVSLFLQDNTEAFVTVFKTRIIENALSVILTGGGVAALVIVFINRSIRPEMIGAPQVVSHFLKPLGEAMDKIAKIEFAEVELRARDLLRAREVTLEHVSQIYTLLYHDFNELTDLMGPDRSPPIRTKTNRIAIECNVECTGGCDKVTGCTCGHGGHVDIHTREAETYLETRNRIRALLDKISSKRGKLNRDLESAFTNLVKALRKAQAQKDDQIFPVLTPVQMVLLAMGGTVLAVVLTCVTTLIVTAWMLNRH